jgi:metallo-beta-lactamase family protein
MSLTVQFLGAAETVTGSKYLVSSPELSGDILVDAGLFQGPREWKEENWKTFPADISKIKAVIITHAHIDHIGYLPRLVKLGLKCPIFMTHATKDLAGLLLTDSAKLQEEEAEFRSRHHVSRHASPQPLYNVEDVKSTLKLIIGVQFDHPAPILDNVQATWTKAGHILGAGSISLQVNLKDSIKKILFSGDIGRYSVPILPDPAPVDFGDLLLIESTYGARKHSNVDAKEDLGNIINRTISRGGMVLIPSFAVGRAQELLFYIRELKEEGVIPNIPIIVDSPMAQDATRIYTQHHEGLDDESLKIIGRGENIFRPDKLHFIRDRSESIELNNVNEPMVLISASGMLAGGRILHHIKFRIADRRNTLLFVGFQPDGGKGAWIKSGAPTVRIFNEEIPINAEIADISSLSAHADVDELLRWCKAGKGTPTKVAVVHGELAQARAFAETLRTTMKWDCFVPRYQEIYKL